MQTVAFDSEGNEEEKEASEYRRSPDEFDNEYDVLTASASVSGSTHSAGGPAGGTAIASYGYLSIDASIGGATSVAFAGVLTDTFYGGHELSSRVRFEDDVIIDAPGMSGMAGTATLHFTLDPYIVLNGFIQPDGVPVTQRHPYMSIDLELNVRVASYRQRFEARESLSPAGEVSEFDFPDEAVAATFNFTYGEPFRLRATLSVDAYMEASSFTLAQGRVSGGLPTGFQWLGMSDLPADATVSGIIDWAKAAPIPFGDSPEDLAPTPPASGGSGGGGGSGGALGWAWLLAAGFGWRRCKLNILRRPGSNRIQTGLRG